MNIIETLKRQIEDYLTKIESDDNKVVFINEVKNVLYELSPERVNPVDRVYWVPKEMVVANEYNPNRVMSPEMKLLYTSIREDGYTQPIVTIWDEERKKYVIVDGFHRHLIMKKYTDIAKRCHDRLPIVIIEKNIDQRMASTIRHNRARGVHSVDGMVNVVFTMMRDGMSERKICEELGLEMREFVKLKYITGFAKIFRNYEYSKAIEKVVYTSELMQHGKDKNK